MSVLEVVPQALTRVEHFMTRHFRTQQGTIAALLNKGRDIHPNMLDPFVPAQKIAHLHAG